MSHDQTTISCPNCGTEIDVNDILYHQVDEQLKKKYQDELKREKQKIESRSSEIELQREALEEERSKQAETLAQQVSEKLKEREAELSKKLKKAAEAEQEGALATLREELDEKSKKVQELNKASAELQKLKREKDELEETLKAAAEKQLNERLASERQKITKEEVLKVASLARLHMDENAIDKFAHALYFNFDSITWNQVFWWVKSCARAVRRACSDDIAGPGSLSRLRIHDCDAFAKLGFL